MLRWLAPKPEVDAVHAHLVAAAGIGYMKKKEKKKAVVPVWAKWPMEKKMEVVHYYSAHGYRAVRLKYSHVPPPSTIRYVFMLCVFPLHFLLSLRTWRDQVVMRGFIRPAGRPRWLDTQEERAVLSAIADLRKRYMRSSASQPAPFYFSVVQLWIVRCSSSLDKKPVSW